jgi:signal transduction histidine kinase
MKVFQKRFQLQLLFALLAAISVATLTVELVANAVRHAQGYVLADTNRALTNALHELQREYRLRRRDDASWSELPAGAQDVTLRAISQTVLASYPGVEGGFWLRSQFAGYAYPTHDAGPLKMDVPPAEKPAIEEVIRQAQEQGSCQRILRGKYDLVVISAVSLATSEGSSAAWAMKRLPGQAEPAERTEGFLLAALVGVALLGAAGVLATGIGLNRGIAQITSGLAALDKDYSPGLPVRRDELGAISAAINDMARTRRSLEAELRREDRLRALGRLVGRIAHEMRNPLNSIRLSLQMLAERQEQGRLHSSDFHMALDEVDRFNRLLSDLLAFQQPRPPKTEVCEIGPALVQCKEMVQPQASKQGVDLFLAGDLDQTAVLDEQYFRQILLNLILNAVDVSKPGQRVDIRAAASNGTLSVEVWDYGPGLTQEQQEHLFEPFYTTKTNGHGLGLAVSRELAQSMGANLSWRNRPHRGATFILQLKRANEQ